MGVSTVGAEVVGAVGGATEGAEVGVEVVGDKETEQIVFVGTGHCPL